MAIIGFGFNKIVVEKNAPVRGKISISNNISITGVEKIDLSLGPAKGKGAKFSFEFKAAYEPKIALISLNGELVYFDKPERIEEIEKGWKSEKKIPEEVMTEVLNHCLTQCSVEALLLGKEMGLPPSIQLPKVVAKEKK